MSQKLRNKANELLALERGAIYKTPGGKRSVCLLYPNTYKVGMSSLGFQGIYTILNSRDDVVCERAFLPEAEDIKEYERTRTELFSLESKRSLADFDIVAFSVSFENDFPHILTMLTLANIPLRASQRNNTHPLIIVGGVCAFSNPEPIAEFMDLIFVGEGEEMIQEFMDLEFSGRDDSIQKGLEVKGIYVPSMYEVKYHTDGTISERIAIDTAPQRIEKRTVMALGAISPSIVTSGAEFADMWLVEAMRGCPWNCNFCLAGHIFDPPRMRPAKDVRADAARGNGARVGLIGPSLSDYPHKAEIMRDKTIDFSITSLRASPNSAELVALMRGRRSVSIAPEAGTQRLRKVINKKVTQEDIIETSRLLFEGGVERLRLYFMVGLPTETMDDIQGIVELVGKIRDVSSKGLIALTVSTFVPKAFTPFQWSPMIEIKEIKKRVTYLKKSLGKVKGVSVAGDESRQAFQQALFAMGDRRLAPLLENMIQGMDLKKAAREADIDISFYTHRARGRDEILPWDFLVSAHDKSKLWERYANALDEVK